MIHLNVGDLYDRAVEFYKDQTAIEFNEISYTYNELGYNAICLANGLRDLGIGKGSKIGLFMKNCPEYLFCEYALAKIGAVRVPLAVLLGAQDRIYMMNQTESNTNALIKIT
jgi:long-chain acyl-CoA synthetase